MEYISCNMGTCDLPEIYTLALGLCPRARVYFSGKSLVPMLQLLHIAWVTGSKLQDMPLGFVYSQWGNWRVVEQLMYFRPP